MENKGYVGRMNVIPPEVEEKFRGVAGKNADLGEKCLYKVGQVASFRAPVGTSNRPATNHF